jgi:dipeptidyl aminopeptidase/acylaminoacyl peptidase
MRRSFILVLAICIWLGTYSQSIVKRALAPTDIYRLPSISDPQVSPDGQWVSYSLTKIDSVKDKSFTTLWMISWDGKEDIQLTHDQENESRARWSPDGKWISFLSSRQDSKGSQLWMLDRRGGEAKRITEFKTGINDYAWSPDAKKLLLTMGDFEPEDTSKAKTTKPFVIERYQYKEDVEGYRYKKLHTHLYLYDIVSKKIDTLTKGNYDEGSAVWSPDGLSIAFVSNRTEDPDKNENSDIYLIDAKSGAAIQQITKWKGADNNPKWSPDGKWIAYTRSTAADDYIMYDQSIICIIPRTGGEPKLLSKSLDRPAAQPQWSEDGNSIFGLVEDDREQYVARFPIGDGQPTKVAGGERSFNSLLGNGKGRWVATISEPELPSEVYAFENGQTRRLTKHMDEFLAPIMLSKAEGFVSTSSDGTKVSGILYRPASPSTTSKLPLILYIHGGPVGQDEFEFDLNRQMLAGAGFAVVAVNYRGSNGRGLDFCKSIYADWGNKEVIDLHGAIDYLIAKGIADSTRLGVGGWSYGGILTDYLITADGRFKAACSGAGTGFTLSLYGVDQYIRQYSAELGAPWQHLDNYLKVSYPFLKADRIKTPTLFLSGEKDFNVPTAGSEQMYQALRALGIPTQLIIYPSQFHGISVPSYQKDRLERYIAWYKKYLTPSP